MEQPSGADAGDDAYYDWQFAQLAPPPAERHRRSDRYRKPVRRQREAQRRAPLIMDDDTPIDGLPPIVSKEDAFRAPVYPRSDDEDTL